MGQRPTIGAIGRALSALTPDGQAEFDGVVFEVRAQEGNPIDPQQHVLVTGFDPQLLLVRQATPEEVAAAPNYTAPPLSDVVADIEAAAEFERKLRQQTPYVPVTATIIGVNVAVFGIMVANGVDLLSPDAGAVLKWGANYGPRTTHGEWWRLLSCTFLHFGILHLLLNMWCLFDVGQLVERLTGNAGFLLLYLVSGVGGSLASLALTPMVVSAGASGAVFGVYGALLGVYLRARRTIPKEILTQHKASTVSFLAYNLVFGLFVPGIDLAAHVGGLLSGFCCGVALGGSVGSASLRGRLARNGGVGLVGGLVLGLAFLLVRAHVARLPDLVGELEQVAAVEERVLKVYNDAVQKSHKQQLADADFLQLPERDVLRPWRSAQQRLAQLKRVPPRSKESLREFSHYMELREQAWELLVRAIRENNPQLAEQSRQKMQEADQLATKLSTTAGGRKH